MAQDRRDNPCNYEESNQKFAYIESHLCMVMVLTFCGGIMSGMLGVGGGMITTPLLLAMGLDAKVINLMTLRVPHRLRIS